MSTINNMQSIKANRILKMEIEEVLFERWIFINNFICVEENSVFQHLWLNSL